MLSRVEKRLYFVPTIKEVKHYRRRSKCRLGRSFTRNDRYKDGYKTSTGEFSTDSSRSERDVKKRRLRSGLNGNHEEDTVIPEKDHTGRFKKVRVG